MFGVIDAVRAFKSGLFMRASHGIGHQLEPMGVGHGETSCVMLPSVLRWNRLKGDAWVADRQKKVIDAFWEEEPSAGDVVGAFVDELGLPRSLRDVGIGRDQLDTLAKNSMTDRNIPTNCVAITKAEQGHGDSGNGMVRD